MQTKSQWAISEDLGLFSRECSCILACGLDDLSYRLRPPWIGELQDKKLLDI